ncbi:SHOCT domain-containing protein [Geotoga petraea]|jgi:putative membrane protein|uniref:Putative membrane protein n=1 Tax=Geotoga petraea TaxID=28234 RepID=A0A1G6PVC6_9BACT|nr:SHOCT domain-containing protein [Geotoga petraea]MDK2946456.1 putative rane protein [Geotoga sp.]TGG86854.1 SHOCT domain-containing protein [Geotoga petraea]SDC84162.1 putative membrane protein [Geotoga petraea]
MMHGYFWNGMWSGGGIFMGIFWILIIVIVLYFVFRNNNNNLTNNGQNYQKRNSVDEALRILNEKYVNGEISEEEYKNKKNNILN